MPSFFVKSASFIYNKHFKIGPTQTCWLLFCFFGRNGRMVFGFSKKVEPSRHKWRVCWGWECRMCERGSEKVLVLWFPCCEVTCSCTQHETNVWTTMWRLQLLFFLGPHRCSLLLFFLLLYLFVLMLCLSSPLVGFLPVCIPVGRSFFFFLFFPFLFSVGQWGNSQTNAPANWSLGKAWDNGRATHGGRHSVFQWVSGKNRRRAEAWKNEVMRLDFSAFLQQEGSQCHAGHLCQAFGTRLIQNVEGSIGIDAQSFYTTPTMVGSHWKRDNFLHNRLKTVPQCEALFSTLCETDFLYASEFEMKETRHTSRLLFWSLSSKHNCEETLNETSQQVKVPENTGKVSKSPFWTGLLRSLKFTEGFSLKLSSNTAYEGMATMHLC